MDNHHLCTRQCPYSRDVQQDDCTQDLQSGFDYLLNIYIGYNNTDKAETYEVDQYCNLLQ